MACDGPLAATALGGGREEREPRRPRGAGAPSAVASSAICVDARSNRCFGSLAVARANQASNAGGSTTPRRAALTLGGSVPPSMIRWKNG